MQHKIGYLLIRYRDKLEQLYTEGVSTDEVYTESRRNRSFYRPNLASAVMYAPKGSIIITPDLHSFCYDSFVFMSLLGIVKRGQCELRILDSPELDFNDINKEPLMMRIVSDKMKALAITNNLATPEILLNRNITLLHKQGDNPDVIAIKTGATVEKVLEVINEST